MMVITSEWEPGAICISTTNSLRIWKIQLLHKFALFQIEYFHTCAKYLHTAQNISTYHIIFPHITKYLHSEQIFPLCTKISTPEQNISTIVYKIFQLCTTNKFFFTAKIVDIGDFFPLKHCAMIYFHFLQSSMEMVKWN